VGKEPDQIRQDIEQTRRELGADVDLLSEKVNPARVVNRRVERGRSAVAGIKERVMGTASQTRSAAGDRASSVSESVAGTVGSAASSVGETVSSAPDTITRKAEGNPLAAGLIAFGVGWLASSLIPASEAERRAAGRVTEVAKERAEPVKSQLAQATGELTENLREPARQAARSVKDSAADAADTVKSEAGSAGEELTSEAARSARTVRDDPRTPGGPG